MSEMQNPRYNKNDKIKPVQKMQKPTPGKISQPVDPSGVGFCDARW